MRGKKGLKVYSCRGIKQLTSNFGINECRPFSLKNCYLYHLQLSSTYYYYCCMCVCNERSALKETFCESKCIYMWDYCPMKSKNWVWWLIFLLRYCETAYLSAPERDLWPSEKRKTIREKLVLWKPVRVLIIISFFIFIHLV